VVEFPIGDKAGECTLQKLYMEWDGKDSRGEPAVRGIYFLRATARDSRGLESAGGTLKIVLTHP